MRAIWARARARTAQSLLWIKTHVPPGLRSVLGVVLILAGLLGILPVLGFWMIPLGVAIILIDLRAVYRVWKGRTNRAEGCERKPKATPSRIRRKR